MPERMTVAAPVSEVRPTSLVGLLCVSVKYPVSHRMTVGEHDADDHREDGDHRRVTASGVPSGLVTPSGANVVGR